MKNLSLFTVLSLSTVALPLTIAAPTPAPDVNELESRQLFALLRGAGRALGKGAKKAPEKAGKKMGKEMGNGEDNVVEGQRLKEVTDRWNKYLGKEQDPKCVQGWMNTFSRNGGFNAVINCDKNRGGLFGNHKGGFYPSVNRASAKTAAKPSPPKKANPPKKSSPKKKAAPKKKSNQKKKPAPKKKKGGKKKRSLLEDWEERDLFVEDELEQRDLAVGLVLDDLE
ncbi:hypothetical protein D9613_007321 [Agrocybe pediades]|uniref:Uncharacterized protein n=1 Tax=Agrocybe pediades TaxID=84607 RepID=A0A8H4VKA9_9AGAR|nr:hypothetical protein D9613_007321 [Agrocybe pediades]